MKLLYCDICGDIFNLTGDRVKSCVCGAVKGVYINQRDAIVNGKGHSIAIGNGSFHSAIMNKYRLEQDKGGNRSKYQTDCRVDYTWIRPHEGEGNPHTIIADDSHEGWGDETS